MVANAVTALVVAMSILLMLLRPRGVAEVWWVCGGALALVALRLIPLCLAANAVAEGADVYFFLAGMMLLSEIARIHGVFDWVSSVAVRSARGSSVRLFTTTYAVGTAVTIFMSNDATAVVLTPAILVAVRKARVDPLPQLFGCAFIANAASFVLPISNPANLVVFRRSMPSLGHWFGAFALPSALSIVTTYVVLRWLFRRQLAGKLEAQIEGAPLTHSGRWALGGIGLVSVVLLVASAFDVDLGVPTFLAALTVAAVVSLVARRNPVPLFGNISWSTLVLVAGLFVLVEAAETIGAVDAMRKGLSWAASLPRGLGMLVVSFAVGVGNNAVNNLPLGLLVGATVQQSHPSATLAHAALIGVDLGPNLALTGSLATILWLVALRREKLDVSFRQFLEIGVVVMPAALAAATLGSMLANALGAADCLVVLPDNDCSSPHRLALPAPRDVSSRGMFPGSTERRPRGDARDQRERGGVSRGKIATREALLQARS